MNKENENGSGAKLLEEFANLCNDMDRKSSTGTSRYNDTRPSEFKKMVNKHLSLFAGNEQ